MSGIHRFADSPLVQPSSATCRVAAQPKPLRLQALLWLADRHDGMPHPGRVPQLLPAGLGGSGVYTVLS